MAAPHPLFEVNYAEAGDVESLVQDENVLACFEFGRSPLASCAPGHVPVALAALEAPAVLEVWRARGPFEAGVLGHVRYVRGLDFSMAHIALDLREHADMRVASRLAYEQLQAFLGRSSHHWPLKIWNTIPGINQGSGDEEIYRHFCVGRAEALAAAYGDQPHMPAATAIGAPAAEPALQVYCLAGALPGLNVENPRQVNAWQYPRQYGPKSPLFSRGTVFQLNGARQFLISGTASVVGHETQHHTVAAQIRESLANVEALLQEGNRLTGTPFISTGNPGVLKVYIRHPDDLDAVAEQLDQSWARALPRIFLHGDICRIDLLTEIDGMVTGH